MLRTSTPRSCAFVQVEVVGHDLPVQRARQLDQLVHLADVGEIDVRHGDVDAAHLLDLLEDIETAAAAVALHGVRRIGDELQFLQDELRDDQRAVEKAGLADVGDAAVDDHARIEDPVVLLRAVSRNSAARRAGSATHLCARPSRCRDRGTPAAGSCAGTSPADLQVGPKKGCPDRLRQAETIAPPMSAPRRSVTSAERRRDSMTSMSAPSAAPTMRLTAADG